VRRGGPGRRHREWTAVARTTAAQVSGAGDLTTATRAYTEARHRGLTEARVGQGTFVVESLSHARRAAGPSPEFDLSMNLPPQPLDADLEGRLTADVQPFNLGPNYRLSALRRA
jgi:DNA-binding transcriptional MocR family regulator